MYARHVFAWYRRSEGSTGSWELSYPKPLEVLCKCSLWFCFVLVTASHYVGLAILELTEIHPPLPLCLSLCLLSTGVKVVKHINALNGGGGRFSSPRYSMSSSLALICAAPPASVLCWGYRHAPGPWLVCSPNTEAPDMSSCTEASLKCLLST